MLEFTPLDQEDSLVNITENSNLLKLNKVTVEIPEDSDIPQIEHIPKKEKENEEDFLLNSSCGIEQYYGDASKEDYFKRENLFSELVNDFQRSKARYNLGIGEEYSLLWGNINGLIDNQEDLINYIHNSFASNINEYTDVINALLAQWGIEMNLRIDQKIDKYSPHLEGIPTTTLPDIDDNSSRIASTEWVNSKLSLNENYNLKLLSLNKTHMFYGDSPQDIVLTWDFYNTPEEIRINGVLVNNTLKSYTFPNIDDDLNIHFSYYFNGEWYNKIINFEKVYAYYYGTENEISSMSRTKNSSMIVNSLPNKFVYLYLPNDGNARLFVDNILGGFEAIASTLINGINYYVYSTVNSGLGELHITYDKQ